jgi:hypothetical protein
MTPTPIHTDGQIRALRRRLTAAGDHEAARAAEALAVALAALDRIKDDESAPPELRREAAKAWAVCRWGLPGPTTDPGALH